MARRRRLNLADSGSLELLLDTITNAFGGIVFLAILIVVLLQTTTDDIEVQPSYDQLDVVEMTLTLQVLEAERQRLEADQKVSDTVAAKLTDPELALTLQELADQTSVRNKIKQEQSKIVAEIDALKKNSEKIERDLIELDSKLLGESQSVESLKTELESERQQRTIKTRFPEERSASKRSFNVCLRYGRWYVDILPNHQPNLEDFAVLDSGGKYLTVTPKPYRGIPITSGNKLSREVLRALSERDPREEHIAIAIWDDSYQEFQLVREYLVSHKFNYRLLPLTDDDEVTYGDVTEVKVQ